MGDAEKTLPTHRLSTQCCSDINTLTPAPAFARIGLLSKLYLSCFIFSPVRLLSCRQCVVNPYVGGTRRSHKAPAPRNTASVVPQELL